MLVRLCFRGSTWPYLTIPREGRATARRETSARKTEGIVTAVLAIHGGGRERRWGCYDFFPITKTIAMNIIHLKLIFVTM